MSRFGENMKSSELVDMMKEADCAGEGKVDYRSKYATLRVLGFVQPTLSMAHDTFRV